MRVYEGVAVVAGAPPTAYTVGEVAESVELLSAGGTRELSEVLRTPRDAPRVLVFAFDGVGTRGMTVARVEHRKRHRDGSWSIGVAMNRSQCATAKPDHAMDPILVPVPGRASNRTAPLEGYLLGARCTESDLLSRRRLRFPLGVARGDL